MNIQGMSLILLGLTWFCICVTFSFVLMFQNSQSSYFYSIESVESTKFYSSTRKFSFSQQHGNNRLWENEFKKQLESSLVAGKQIEGKKLVTIGIATVFREENYLQETLKFLVKESTPAEREDAVVVIYLADTKDENKQIQLQMIHEEFSCYLESGFIQVISSNPDIYPSMLFAINKRTFNDTADRVLWRTKQVIDFTFLFSYAKDLSTYYLVLEDDVISAPHYITSMKKFIIEQNKKSNRWTALHFTEFLGIGLLFHNSEILDLCKFLTMFHQAQPVDELMRKYIEIQAPLETLPRLHPSLFQHIGIKSTLPNKIQLAWDSSFNQSVVSQNTIGHLNPEAALVTSMKAFNNSLPLFPYLPDAVPFVASCSPSDTFDIILAKPQPIQRIFIVTGVSYLVNNVSEIYHQIADGGTLEASISLKRTSDNCSETCDTFVPIRKFHNGRVDAEFPRNISSFNGKFSRNDIRCVRLKIGMQQFVNSQIVITKIEIYNAVN